MNLHSRIHATEREQVETLPGDGFVRHAADTLTHAITLDCNYRELWPWLVQMGADRAGWYSYDLLDNGGWHSAEQILRRFQSPSVGTVFPALPGTREGFVLIDIEPTHWLVLGWPSATGEQMVTWAFVLRELGPNTTRLIVRARASEQYKFHGLPNAFGLWLARVVHFIMERKQLVELARRAEGRVSCAIPERELLPS
jgi:hypothetical protein